MNKMEVSCLNNKDLLQAMADYNQLIKDRLKESNNLLQAANLLIQEQDKLIKEYQTRLKQRKEINQLY